MSQSVRQCSLCILYNGKCLTDKRSPHIYSLLQMPVNIPKYLSRNRWHQLFILLWLVTLSQQKRSDWSPAGCSVIMNGAAVAIGNILGLSVLPAVTASDRINQNTDDAFYKQVQSYKVDKQEMSWVMIRIHNMHTKMQNTVWVKAAFLPSLEVCTFFCSIPSLNKQNMLL